MNSKKKIPVKHIKSRVAITIILLVLFSTLTVFIMTSYRSSAVTGVESGISNLSPEATISPDFPTNNIPDQNNSMSSNVYLPLINSQGESHEDSISNWHVYEDNRAGFSLKYPNDWEIASSIPGEYLLIYKPWDYYRGIRFYIEKNPNRLSPASFINLSPDDVTASALQLEPFQNHVIDGLLVKDPIPGIINMIVFSQGDLVIKASLLQDGEHGGGLSSSLPTVQEDEQIFLTILETFTFPPSKK